MCASGTMIFVRELRGLRTHAKIPLFLCLRCHSLYNPSDYREDNEQFQKDLNAHIYDHEESKKRAETIIKELLGIHPHAKTLLDIGASIGTIVETAQRFSLSSKGIEPNKYAVSYAEKNYNIQLQCTFFDRNSYEAKFDIITLIHVLEHQKNPQRLLEDTLASLAKGGILYISVPFFNIRRHWKHILLPNRKQLPFGDPDRHMVHFSVKGLKQMAVRLNALCVKELLKEDWGWWSGGLVFRISK